MRRPTAGFIAAVSFVLASQAAGFVAPVATTETPSGDPAERQVQAGSPPGRVEPADPKRGGSRWGGCGGWSGAPPALPTGSPAVPVFSPPVRLSHSFERTLRLEDPVVPVGGPRGPPLPL
jgi:hypothetical protein